MAKRNVLTHLMLERLVGIHRMIKSGSYPNTQRLADEFNDGKGTATISRDIEFLRSRFNAPIEYDYKHRGYYYTEEYDMPFSSISQEKLASLFAAKKMLSHFKDSPMYSEMSNVIDFLADSSSDGNSDFLSRIALSPSPKFVVDAKIWSVITMALHENSVIEFDYTGRWKTEKTHRRVQPYQLVLDNGRYYLYGFDEGRKGTRLFSLSRIKNPVATKDTFDLSDDFDFEAKCGGGKFGTFLSAEPDHYKIEFYDTSRQLIKECIWADGQVVYDDDSRDCTTIEFNSTQYFNIEEWVLAQGANAKPIEPEWLVEDWKEHIRLMMKSAGIK